MHLSERRESTFEENTVKSGVVRDHQARPTEFSNNPFIVDFLTRDNRVGDSCQSADVWWDRASGVLEEREALVDRENSPKSVKVERN
jgi:hypothetical protein